MNHHLFSPPQVRARTSRYVCPKSSEAEDGTRSLQDGKQERSAARQRVINLIQEALAILDDAAAEDEQLFS